MRLSPLIPFNISNYFCGVTKVGFWPYVLASAGGMLPGTLFYADERSNDIHVNFREDVEAVAAAYFSPEEKPVALEIRHADITGLLAIGDAVASKPWQQVLLHQPNILFSTVVAVHELELFKREPAMDLSSCQMPDNCAVGQCLVLSCLLKR